MRFINSHIGYGVVATRPIPRGTITWVRDELDQLFDPEQVAGMAQVYRDILDKYCFMDGMGRLVLCWDLARFLNHSCRATCLAPGMDFEIAVRDIAAGEELTDDYGALNIEAGFDCLCGEACCRGHIRPDDPERLVSAWDALIAGAFPRIEAVEQPLWAVVREKEQVRRSLAGAPVPSCGLHYRP